MTIMNMTMLICAWKMKRYFLCASAFFCMCVNVYECEGRKKQILCRTIGNRRASVPFPFHVPNHIPSGPVSPSLSSCPLLNPLNTSKYCSYSLLFAFSFFLPVVCSFRLTSETQEAVKKKQNKKKKTTTRFSAQSSHHVLGSLSVSATLADWQKHLHVM